MADALDRRSPPDAMDWVTVIWSVMAGACLMLALMHLVIWCRDRNSWASLCFVVTVTGVLGLEVFEMATMTTDSTEVFGWVVRRGTAEMGLRRSQV